MKEHLLTILKLWKILQPFHKHFYIQLAFIFLAQFFIIGFAKLNSGILNNLVEKNVSQVVIFFSIWGFLTLVDIYVDYVARLNRQKNLEEPLYSYLHEFSFRKLLGLTIEQHTEDHSAFKLTVIQKGETATQRIIAHMVTVVLPTITLVLLTLITLSFYSKEITLFSLIFMAGIFTYAYKANKKLFPTLVKNRDNWNTQQKIRMEAFSHLQLVKNLNREADFIKKYLLKRIAVVQHHLTFQIARIKVGTIRATMTDMSSFVTLVLAAYFFLEGKYNIGTIYLIWALTSRVYNQISTLSNTMREIPALYVDAEKYLNTINTEPSFKESGKKKMSLTKDITITNLAFSYPKGEISVFSDVSLIIPAKKITAFVGASGSGKSTIIKLLIRAYDYKKGSIKIGPVELKTIDAGYLRERIGYVEQHVDLFDETIKENILISVPKKDRLKAEKKLKEIARKTRIDQFYHRLGKSRFDTLVGERGIKLSGGERQRVGIARAIIKDPDILIFDEATASLDSENESKVMEAINDVSKGKTTIIIAHRLSTVRNADKIIVMDKGRVVGEGTHEELSLSSPVYKNLVEHQLSS